MYKPVFQDPITKTMIEFTPEQIRKMPSGERHLVVSSIPTPADYVEKIQGVDYVKCEYMREIAWIWYGAHSFSVIREEVVADPEENMWLKVHGRLHWKEDNTDVNWDNVSSHRLQYKKETQKFSDLGNDTKAAVTDCLKKCYNLGMNISDDIYRWVGPALLEPQKDHIKRELAETTKNVTDSRVTKAVEGQVRMLNRASYQTIMQNIKAISR